MGLAIINFYFTMLIGLISNNFSERYSLWDKYTKQNSIEIILIKYQCNLFSHEMNNLM